MNQPMTLAWIADPTDPRVKAAQARHCGICCAHKDKPRICRQGQLCANTIRPREPLPGRVIHVERATRMTDVDNEPVEKDGS